MHARPERPPPAPKWTIDHLHLERAGTGSPFVTAARVVEPWGTAAGVRCAACWASLGQVETTDAEGVARSSRCGACGPGEALASLVTRTRLPWRWRDVAMGRRRTERRAMTWRDWSGGDGRGAVRAWRTQLVEGVQPPGLLLAGPPGVGKSHTAAAAVGAAWRAGIEARWLSWPGFLAELRATFDTGTPTRAVWQAALPTWGLLVVDDLGMGPMSAWGKLQAWEMGEVLSEDVTLVATTNAVDQVGLVGLLGEAAARRILGRSDPQHALTVQVAR